MDGHGLGLQEFLGRSQVDITWWQMSLRAAIVFVFGLAVIRIFGRTAFGKQSPLDIVAAMIIGSNLSRALTGNAPLLPTLAATFLLVIGHWALAHLAARSPGFEWLVKGSAIPLFRDGQPDRARLRRAGLDESDLEEAARRAGHARLAEIGEATLERSGKVSATRRRG